MIPASVRQTVRRWFARRQRPRVRNIWPILPGSERKPDAWPGWPQGKKFALVLTHDIESQMGLDRCRQLMELEMKHGFRSSFNFIPEGNYRVNRELRDHLVRHGFENGIHDLHHDGRLYQNRSYFARKAVQINQHLKDWNAVGFRSGFMLHNLEWLQDLEIQYDASTFDTDPFEPQPDNIGTIFPFWVPGLNGTGYVELPYTLPQDSTLFLLLGETNPNIWIQKLDWIAEKQGMALINVHPDYMRFSGEPAAKRTYPSEYYEDFLKYIADHYAGQFWNVLPKDLAAWYRTSTASLPEIKSRALFAEHPAAHPEALTTAQTLPVQRAGSRRVCMVAYSNYENDNRVLRYAEELAKRGDHVEVMALKREKNQPTEQIINGVHLRRVQRRSRKDQRNKISFLFPLLPFFLFTSILLTWRHLKKPYDIIHVHNMPDFLVFTAWFPKLTGCKIILDIHDIVPEFYSSKFDISSNSRSVKMLKNVERASARFSNHVIVSNHLWFDTFAKRNSARDKCSVFINNVNSSIFFPRPRRRDHNKFIILFPGGLQWHQGLDIALRAFKKIVDAAPQAEFHIYGDGNMKQSLVDLTHELALDDRIKFFAPLPVHQIADIMANADLGVVPKRADSFGDKAYSTKIMEFMALGVPVIVSSTTIDRYYFNDSVVQFFPSGDIEALGAAMLKMINDQKLRQQIAGRALEYAQENSWETRKNDYLHLIDSLCTVNGHNGKSKDHS